MNRALARVQRQTGSLGRTQPLLIRNLFPSEFRGAPEFVQVDFAYRLRSW
jgi:hypothetical protein